MSLVAFVFLQSLFFESIFPHYNNLEMALLSPTAWNSLNSMGIMGCSAGFAYETRCSWYYLSSTLLSVFSIFLWKLTYFISIPMKTVLVNTILLKYLTFHLVFYLFALSLPKRKVLTLKKKLFLYQWLFSASCNHVCSFCAFSLFVSGKLMFYQCWSSSEK